MTKQLMTWAQSVSGMGKRSGKAEFASQQALQSYMRQHPKADASKHTVAQPAQRAEVSAPNEAAKHPAQKAGESVKAAEARGEAAVRSKSPEAHAEAAAAFKKAAGEHWRLEKSTQAAKSRFDNAIKEHEEAARDPKIAAMWSQNMQRPDRAPEPHHLTENSKKAQELSDKAAISQRPEDHQAALAAMKAAANENLQLNKSSAAAHRRLGDLASQHEQAANDPKIAAMWHANVHG